MLLANMGVPIVCVAIPTMLVALVPIAGIEALVYHKWLRRSFKDSFRGALIANLLSTILGIPLMWLPLLIGQIALGGSHAWGMETPEQRLQAVTLQAAWLIPYRDHIAWMIPAASLVLLLPFYLGSVIVEYISLAGRWRNLPRKRLLTSVAIANGLSYLALGLYYACQLWLAVRASTS
jgi:hypothetical protein